jgi:hypothetical protein
MVTPESESEYHGHVRNWDEMTDNMRNSFIKNGLTDKRGNIINPQLRIPLNGTAKGESGEEER